MPWIPRQSAILRTKANQRTKKRRTPWNGTRSPSGGVDPKITTEALPCSTKEKPRRRKEYKKMQWNVKREASDDLNRKEQDIQREHTIPRAHVATWPCCATTSHFNHCCHSSLSQTTIQCSKGKCAISCHSFFTSITRGKHEGKASSIMRTLTL